MSKRVEAYLQDRIAREGAIHLTLLDPEKTGGLDCAFIAEEAEAAGSAAIMVGGSTVASNTEIDEAVLDIKERVKIPVILFPNNIIGVSKYADAIWFMSLLNSDNTYYIIEAQALSAFTVKKYGLEVLPMGYIIVGSGGTAGYVGHARGIPHDKPELALAYSLAGENLGMRYIYLEAGSGVLEPVPPRMIGAVKKYLTSKLIVGGAIRSPEAAKAARLAGADMIVTGNMVEDKDQVRKRISEVVSALVR